MCLAVPMKVISVKGKKAFADLGGVKREIDISLVKNIKVGDYIIVHAGFAIQKLNKKEALNTLELFKQIKNETY
ncbi:MAG TPA: HypC/HybG/HupF family hydrogenase formation chaperone [bacterium]|nr:HypC/HybG/HupF family hydrogenase formation chaperone [bacterium]HOL49680.1 HypC/HybG/HupF family hydrogenase formation chaperone [bacterium]HPO52400.1 HypC/HybG/HupF family hydrogenase formation chaperone [bacterium]